MLRSFPRIVLIAGLFWAGAAPGRALAQARTYGGVETQSAYGEHILLVEGASWLLALGAGFLADNEGDRRFGEVLTTGWSLGIAGSMAVHAFHDNRTLGLASLGARLVLPGIGAALGYGVGCGARRDGGDCEGTGARWGFIGGIAGAVALDAVALAREHGPVDLPPWYGDITLGIDASLFALSIPIVLIKGQDGDFSQGELAATAAMAPYIGGLLLSPWVHAFHGRIGLAFASLGMRALGAPIGALLGLAAQCVATAGGSGCSSRGAAWGLIGGLVVTATADIALLSYERAPKLPRSTAAVEVVPYLAPSESGVTVGLAGRL